MQTKPNNSRPSNPKNKARVTPLTTDSSKPAKARTQSEFVKGLIATGSPTWSKAPDAVRTRYRSIFLILFSVPLILALLYELYRRLEGKSVKRVRQGELLDDAKIRYFSEPEKWANERESWSYKLFGKDWFLDGFTSRTMREDPGKK